MKMCALIIIDSCQLSDNFTQKKSIQTMLSGSLYACNDFIVFRRFPAPAGQCFWNDRIHASY